MKNIFRTLAIVALGFFATSCVSAVVDEVQMASGDGVVNFTLAAPQHNSRVIADGKSATDLTCAVYDANWDYLTTVKGEFTGGALTTTVSIRLVNAKTYNFVFWAEVPGNPHYTKNFGTTPGEQVLEPNITVNYNSNVAGDANDETRDAFFGKLLNLTINGTMNEYVPLKRPFAQINFGTLDTEAAKVGGFDITTATVSKFTTRAYTTLNLANGEATNEVDVEFTDNELPVEDLYLMADTQKTTPYNWLAMNYILWPETEGSLSTCTMVITDNDTTPESVEIKYPNAPVRRNWRTNLVGNLLTDNVIIEVEILPIPEGDLPNTPASNLAQAAVVGGEVVLTEDMTLDSSLEISERAVVTIDLKGHTLTFANGATLTNNGTLTITDSSVTRSAVAGGSVANAENYAIYNNGTLVIDYANINGKGGICSNGGKVTINGGSFTAAAKWQNQQHNHVCYVANSELVINGGTFDATVGGGTNAMFGIDTNGVVTINGGTIKSVNEPMPSAPVYIATYNNDSAKMVVNGGTFFGGWRFNSAANTEIHGGNFTVLLDGQSFAAGHKLVVDGGVFNCSGTNYLNPTNHLAEGYKAVANAEGTIYTVVAETPGTESSVLHEESGLLYNGNDAYNQGVYYLTNAADLDKAIDYFVGKTGEGRGVTFELLADLDLTGVAWEPWDIMWITFNGNNHTISNLTTTEGWRSGFFGYAGAVKVENLTIENATVVGAQAGILAGAAEGLIVNNVKIAGNNSVTYKPYSSSDHTETWGGVGAVVGVCSESTINVEIVEGAVVDVNSNGIVTEAPFVDALTGYIQPNKGAVVVNGTVNINIDTKIVANSTGTTYVGEVFENPMSDALVLENATLSGDASIEVKRTYKAIVIENVKGSLNGDFITIDNNNNGVMVLQNLDLTLADGKKLIKSTNTIYQVFMSNITINGVKVTTETVAQYLENVAWYQVVEEI